MPESECRDRQLFEEWMKAYDKCYSGKDEWDKRFAAFQQNIRQKEAEETHFPKLPTLKDIKNPFLDMTYDDFMREFIGHPAGADYFIPSDDEGDGYVIPRDQAVPYPFQKSGVDVPKEGVKHPRTTGGDDVPEQAAKHQRTTGCDENDTKEPMEPPEEES